MGRLVMMYRGVLLLWVYLIAVSARAWGNLMIESGSLTSIIGTDCGREDLTVSNNNWISLGDPYDSASDGLQGASVKWHFLKWGLLEAIRGENTKCTTRPRAPAGSVSVLTSGLQSFVLGCALACLRRLSEWRSLVRKVIIIIIILMTNEAQWFIPTPSPSDLNTNSSQSFVHNVHGASILFPDASSTSNTPGNTSHPYCDVERCI